MLGALCAAIALAVSQFAGGALETGAWGLCFRTEGQLPTGPASIQELKEYNAAYVDATAKKVLYLTFDAGYENGCTEKILDVLKKHNVPAAFFLVGNYIEKNADLVRRMVDEGHIVGNHTMHHFDMSKLVDKEAFAKELQEATGLPVHLWDERRTTVEAHNILSQHNYHGKKRKDTVDAVAASLILEGYLAFRGR